MKRKSLFRLLTTILGVLLATALIAAGCGDDDEDTTATTAPPATAAPPETTTEAPVPAEDPIHVGLVFDIGGRGDQSFNDSAAEGIERAEADLGITFDEVSPNDDGSNRANLLQLQAESADLVLGIGFLFVDDMRNVAAANPDTCFGIVDGFIEEATDNVAMLLFAEHEGSSQGHLRKNVQRRG